MEVENWQVTAAIEQKHLSIPLHWEWTSLSRESYPWNICDTHIQHRQSRKKQRSMDSCCSLMTLSSFEWVPFTKESFHITAWNPFRQYDGHLRSASTRILWLWVGFEKHNTTSRQNYLLGDKFGYGESEHLSLLSGWCVTGTWGGDERLSSLQCVHQHQKT